MRYDPKTDSYSADEYQKPNPYPESKAARIGSKVIFGVCLVLLVVVVCVTRARAAADWLCDYVAALSVYDNVKVAEWIGYPEGWADLPSDLSNEMILPVSEDGEQFYLLRSSASAGETWLWTFKSSQQWANTDGSNHGDHDFCEAVLRIKH